MCNILKIKYLTISMLLALTCPTVCVSALERSPSPEGALAYFITPTNGERVPSTFTVRFGLKNMGVAPAGISVNKTGHHHLLVDLAQLPTLDEPLPSNSSVRHFGIGQTEVSLKLASGTHTLQLLLGNHAHVPHDPPVVSRRITVTVE